MTQRDNGNEVLAKLTIAACTEERTLSKVSKFEFTPEIPKSG
jgi:hypothetical protein